MAESGSSFGSETGLLIPMPIPSHAKQPILQLSENPVCLSVCLNVYLCLYLSLWLMALTGGSLLIALRIIHSAPAYWAVALVIFNLRST